MKEKNILIYISILIVGILVGTYINSLINKDDSYVPYLKVVGDIETPFSIKNMSEFEQVKIEHKGEKINAVSLKSIIDKAKPINDNNKIVLMGIDGMVAALEYSQMEGSYISFSSKNGWESINHNHPVSSNVKMLKEILVISEENNFSYGLNIIDVDKNIKNYTPGQMYFTMTSLYPYFIGESKVDNNGQEYKTEVYEEKNLTSLKQVVDIDFNCRNLVMGALGESREITEDGRLEINDNSIDYIRLESRDKIENVVGIILDAPQTSITDAYYDGIHYLENNENVLLIFLDGFGYHQYEYAIENGYAPFLKSLNKMDKALSVYKPVTNAGFAAMITGQTPEVNGVYSRDQKDLKVPSIFEFTEENGLKSVLLEGDIKILNTEIEPLLNLDTNENGTSDDEIFDAAVEKLNEGYNFMLVHFHSIDDSGHTYGDINENTMNTIKTIDNYVKYLVENWKGKVIITSDHGMHLVDEDDKYGSHGEFRCEDLIVPYGIFKGGID